MEAEELAELKDHLDRAEGPASRATPAPWWASPVAALPGRFTIRGGPGGEDAHRRWARGETRPIARIEPAPDTYGEPVNNPDADATHIARWDPGAVRALILRDRLLVLRYESAVAANVGVFYSLIQHARVLTLENEVECALAFWRKVMA